MSHAQNLVADQVPLTGKHLIEASAGTGKTYNITRLYLRLLLEKDLTVEQILVMTFTKDATEEIRGRIDAFIREALHEWDTLVTTEPFFIALNEKVDENQAKIKLKQALLYLDNASIFTIHGFCKRVLSEHAFDSGLAFNMQMETDCQDIILTCCQDWYRVMASSHPSDYALVHEFWPTPEQFLSQFSKAISKQNTLDVVKETDIKDTFITLLKQALAVIEQHESYLIEQLVDVKKGKERDVRIQELQALLAWLRELSTNFSLPCAPLPDKFFSGNRYARSKEKANLLEIFDPIKQVKTQLPSLTKKINKAKALAVVREGIYQIRSTIAHEKNRLSVLSFDDLISCLAERLSSENGHVLAQQLFKQYPVALVDECQDTDPLQFSILQSIYYQQKDTCLFMIGDPKQAIYGFRGGDVFAYLAARENCDYRWLMDTNWRSSEAMINGYNRLFYGAELNESAKNVFGYDIDYLPVKASPIAKNKVRGEGETTGLNFIHFKSVDDKKAVPQSFRKNMAQWVANEIADLLSNKKQATQAQDIAILVRDTTEALEIKQALEQQNLASVFLSNRSNLLQSKQTFQLIQLLKGIVFVENERLFSAALATELLGNTPEKFYQLQQDELAWQAVKYTFEQYREQWSQKGFISMALSLMHQHFCLRAQDKDRTLTNLLHLFELLQSASQRHRQPQALLHWFEQQSQSNNPELEAELRLESDENLIKIVTQHGAKGLEYPVVFVPFATRHKDPLKVGNKAHTFIEYHDETGKLLLSLDGSDDAKQAMANEAYAESIRLLYVAITRAESSCYVLTTAFDKYEKSPLGQTLAWQKSQAIEQHLQTIVENSPNDISLSLVDDTWSPVEHILVTEKVEDEARVASFNGKIERDWWLSSFSALSRNHRHNGVSLPDRDNEELSHIGLAFGKQQEQMTNRLAFDIAKGAHTGNLLHDILEHCHFQSPDWSSHCKWPLTKYGELPSPYNEQHLYQWCDDILDTPIRDFAGDLFTLRSIGEDHCLKESEFYFPMEGAESGELANILQKHRQRLHQYSHSNINNAYLPNYKKLKGMMHGFIDLMFAHQGRYYICDYKSTFIGNHYQDYNMSAMQQNVEDNYYDLQYLIYALALHRYLSHTLDDYQFDTQFGGICYLYLRGMTSHDEFEGCGVYHQKITFDEISRLDELFKGVGI